ncbi:MAG: hypothetical protein ACPLRX_02465 [Candidatus Saccharicenans sp.]
MQCFKLIKNEAEIILEIAGFQAGADKAERQSAKQGINRLSGRKES